MKMVEIARINGEYSEMKMAKMAITVKMVEDGQRRQK